MSALSRRVPATAVFLFVFFGMALFYGRAVIQNDGITYYALTKSLIHDGNFDLTNESHLYRDLRTFQSPITNRIASQYSCGYSLLYAPLLALSTLFPSLNSVRPYAQNATFPFTDTLAIFIGTLLFGFLSIFVAYKTLLNVGTEKTTAYLISFAIFCGTPLIFYTFTTPSFIHASDTFIVSMIFYITVRKDPAQVEKSHLRNVLLGFVLGLSVLLRNINVFLIPPIVLWLLYFERQHGKKRMLITLSEIVAGGIPLLILQLCFNTTQYGGLVTTGYAVPNTDDLHDYFRMFKVLRSIGFHPSIGIFVWSPVTILSICGLIVGIIKRKPYAILAALCILSVVGSICFFRVIWPGASFGNRFLTHLYIFWVIGLYEIILYWRKPAFAVSTALVLWTFLLFNVYYIIFPSQISRKVLGDPRSVTPIKFIQAAIAGYQSDVSASNPLTFWYRSIGSGQYPSLHSLILHPDTRHKPKLRKKKALS